MTFGNMRANGVRTLAAWCLGRGCDHFRIVDVSAYADDLPVPSFGPRLRCERCGHLRDRPAASSSAGRPRLRFLTTLFDHLDLVLRQVFNSLQSTSGR
jgi:hypothetical protein